MERDAVMLRAELSRVVRGRGKRFSAELRRRVVEFGQRRRVEGASWSLVGSELGMNYKTVRRWCLEKGSMALRRVEIVSATREPTAGIIVVSPSGFRAEGLTVRDVVVVLAALR
jgi:hypothetical protein